jgi:hypothetical protein
MAIKFTLNH